MSDMRVPTPFDTDNYPRNPPETDLRTYAWIVHGMYAASFLTGFTCIVGLVMAYVKRGEAVGTIYESHMTYAIRTFWIGLALTVVSLVLVFVVIGAFMLVAVGVWFIVRVVRPFIALADGQPISNPTGFF